MQRRSVEVLSSFICWGLLEVKEGEFDGIFGLIVGYIVVMLELIYCFGNVLFYMMFQIVLLSYYLVMKFSVELISG